jgi:hypothetical protein
MGIPLMGLKTIKIGAREAVELACDNVAHHGEQPRAWFDCGSDLGNLSLAMAAGWERRKANGIGNNTTLANWRRTPCLLVAGA